MYENKIEPFDGRWSEERYPSVIASKARDRHQEW